MANETQVCVGLNTVTVISSGALINTGGGGAPTNTVVWESDNGPPTGTRTGVVIYIDLIAPPNSYMFRPDTGLWYQFFLGTPGIV